MLKSQQIRKEKLLELIEELEKSKDPDRELDGRIVTAIFGGKIIYKMANGTMDTYPVWEHPSENHVGGVAKEPVPRYTASIDDAYSLMPTYNFRGGQYQISSFTAAPWSRPSARVFAHHEDKDAEGGWGIGQAPGQKFGSHGANLATAVTVAILRLRAETGQFAGGPNASSSYRRRKENAHAV